MLRNNPAYSRLKIHRSFSEKILLIVLQTDNVMRYFPLSLFSIHKIIMLKWKVLLFCVCQKDEQKNIKK
jgi:hypothetical protein